MNYSSLMVNLELGHLNTGLLQVASDMADLFHADVIGIATCQPMQMTYDAAYVATDFFEQARDQINQNMRETEAEFRQAMQTHAQSLEWRSCVMTGSPADYVANEARSADLLITGVGAINTTDAPRNVDTGSLIMQLGRPVLMVPIAIEKLRMDQVMIAWKDSRESRRAVLDALPLLKMAAQVSVVALFGKDEKPLMRKSLDDVVNWLKKHGVIAESIEAAADEHDARQLDAIANTHGISIIVAGAYGHSRLREWALGGVTRDLLLNGTHCAFVSH